MTATPLWIPSAARQQQPNLACFIAGLNEANGLHLSGFRAIHGFSVNEPEKFWRAVWDYAGVKAETRGDRVLADGGLMPGARFFPDARLNYAQNLLVKNDDTDALIFRGEDCTPPSQSCNRPSPALA
jgi:acetoacetyl-CoA synthetase